MPRTPRVVLPDIVHHVVARGNNHMRIFTSAIEKRQYLARFAEIAAEEKVLIHGYCLMDNHEHWVLTPSTSAGLAQLFRRVHTWWAMTFNRRHGHSGHLFQARFHSSPMSESHYWEALRYVELNPTRANLVRRPEAFEFSSAHAHLSGIPNGSVRLSEVVTRARMSPRAWKDFLGSSDAAREAELRRAIPLSRPCGSLHWTRELEARFHRKLVWSPPGRPPHTCYQAAG